MLKSCFICLSVAWCLCFYQRPARAAEYCVDPLGGGTHTSLQVALDAAKINGSDDTIKVVQGTYNGNFGFYSTEGDNLAIEGGYTSGCTDRKVNPANTILDGGNTDSVIRLSDTEGGNIIMDGFFVRNGKSTAGGGGVYVYVDSATVAGNITISNNIFVGNSTDGNGGGVYAFSTSPAGVAGTVILTNNIVSENSANGAGGVFARSYSPSGTAGTVILTNNVVINNNTVGAGSHGGGVFASSYSISGMPGSVTLTNNTITSNTAVANGGGVNMYAYSGSNPGGTVNCYNNIIRGNASVSGGDIYLVVGSSDSRYGYNNNYSVISGTWNGGSANNIDKDPLFLDSSTGDYHLESSSPCIDAGNNSAPALPDFDFEGDERKRDGNNDGTVTVDMGVDEAGFMPFFWPMFVPVTTNSKN